MHELIIRPITDERHAWALTLPNLIIMFLLTYSNDVNMWIHECFIRGDCKWAHCCCCTFFLSLYRPSESDWTVFVSLLPHFCCPLVSLTLAHVLCSCWVISEMMMHISVILVSLIPNQKTNLHLKYWGYSSLVINQLPLCICEVVLYFIALY